MKQLHTILIVDDDADDREIIRDAFEASPTDRRYVFLDNGDQLLQHLEQEVSAPTSMIMLDLNMPGKDGKEIVKTIKGDDRFHPIPVIVFTTSSSHRDRQAVYAAGANCFVTKPDTFNKLIELTAAISRLWLE